MATALRLVDASPTGKPLRTLRLVVESPRLSVGDLIRSRVRQEVEAYNRSPTPRFNGLVQPTATEADLNGYGRQARRQLDADEQCRVAVQAFERGGFFMLVGDRQVERLDEWLDLDEDTEVSFVKLVPLVGG